MNEWQVQFTHEAEEDLKRLDKPIQKRVTNKIIWLSEKSSQIDHQSLSNLWRDYFKLRVGDWRIIYQIDYSQHLITIFNIENRDKVYRKI